MTQRHRPSSDNCRAGGQTEYNLARNASRSSSKASHSNNVCWIVSDSRDSQQGHCAFGTGAHRAAMLAAPNLRIAGGAGTLGHGRDILEGRPVDRRTASGLLLVATPGGANVAIAPSGTRARDFRLALAHRAGFVRALGESGRRTSRGPATGVQAPMRRNSAFQGTLNRPGPTPPAASHDNP